jgi:tetratricopeptide (TPR) repeat protein
MHTTNPHLQRTEVLLSQRRYDLAENEARQAIGHDPDHPLAYAYLALCLSEREQWQEATEAAQRAISLEPGEAFYHYALAVVLRDREMLKEAKAAIEEAIRLDLDSPDHWAVLAGIHVARKKFREALEAADRGLAADAQHESCVNLRAIALTNLGDRVAAGAAIDSTLERNPLNPVSHANMGWTLLHQGEPKKAAEHFREALRLDPESDWAKSGIVEAMKARSPIYRAFLWYFLFMGRLPAQAQWGIMIGGYVAYQVVRNVRSSNPGLAPVLTPLIAAYFVFALGTIVSMPLFNLLLLTDRFGRYVLSRDQKWGAAAFGLALLPPLAFLGLWAGVGGVQYEVGALLTGLLIIPVALAGLASPGRARRAMVAIAAALAAACIFMYGSLMTGTPVKGWIMPYVLACFGSTWLANIFSTSPNRPKR